MPTNTLTAENDEDSIEEQIHTVALDGDELHHLKMIALRNLEENASTRQILQDTLTGQQASLKRVYDTARTAQAHRQNNDTICKYDSVRLSVSDTSVTAIVTSLNEYPEEDWNFVQESWRRSVRRLVDQVEGERHNVSLR
jgi:hypothetical protein